jgi:hypothetical protein
MMDENSQSHQKTKRMDTKNIDMKEYLIVSKLYTTRCTFLYITIAVYFNVYIN